ncbi:MAG: hypothetical protein LC648_03750 [Novosphingobium sp.]|nr:hypothetical protein [Novosphingobium sp.]
MPERSDISMIPIAGAVALLSACAMQPRVHSARELSALADRCDVWPTELAQHRERPEIFYFLKPTASEVQLICVARWAKNNHLRLVYVEAVEEEAPETTEP